MERARQSVPPRNLTPSFITFNYDTAPSDIVKCKNAAGDEKEENAQTGLNTGFPRRAYYDSEPRSSEYLAREIRQTNFDRNFPKLYQHSNCRAFRANSVKKI